jgi:hypothetical protein
VVVSVENVFREVLQKVSDIIEGMAHLDYYVFWREGDYSLVQAVVLVLKSMNLANKQFVTLD